MTGGAPASEDAIPQRARWEQSVVDQLRDRGQSIAVAESLTGGLVVARLVDPPGASDVVLGGIVAYAAQAKAEVLGVPEATIEKYGTVSRDCALAMAAGVRERLGSDWGISTTGVAGPAPSEGHPVGTVHIAVIGEHRRAHRMLSLGGDRIQIRQAAVDAVLQLLLDTLDAD